MHQPWPLAVLLTGSAFACAVKPGYAAGGLVKLPPGIQSPCHDEFARLMLAKFQTSMKNQGYTFDYVELFKVTDTRQLPPLALKIAAKITAAGFTTLVYNQKDGDTVSVARATPNLQHFFFYQAGPADTGTYLLLARYE